MARLLRFDWVFTTIEIDFSAAEYILQNNKNVTKFIQSRKVFQS